MQSGDVNRYATGQGSNGSSRAGSEASPAASPNAGIVSAFSQHNAPRDTSTVMQAADSNEEQSFAYFTTGDDDDADLAEDMEPSGLTKKDLHTLNEQKRRDVIKQGYTQLGDLVPTCRTSPNGAKLSRAAVLQRTIDYVVHLQSQAEKHQEQLEQLEREVQALRIMRDNYAQIAQTSHDGTSGAVDSQVPDDVKFQVFQGIADQLFPSFNSSISVTNFDTLSSCIINWLEEYCKPQLLRGIVVGSLGRVNALSAVGTSEQVDRDRVTSQMQ